MPKRESKGKMGESQKLKIAESVRKRALEKRIEQGLPETDNMGINLRKKALELIKMRDQKFDPDLFIPMKTGKAIDTVFSSIGGVPKACNFILIGDPGAGKTTVGMDVCADLVEAGYSCLFVSAEMTKIDLYGYCQRYPKFGNLDILFLGEYSDDNPKEVFEEALSLGYDFVLIDSFVEVKDTVKEVSKMTGVSAEKWLMDTMIKNNLANNERNKHTTFLCIQQVTKDGNFLGTNKIKHNTTGMLELRFEDDDEDISYLEFSKNRRGSVRKKLYFSLKSLGNVSYETKAPEDSEEEVESDERKLEDLHKNADAFDKLFSIDLIGKNEGQLSPLVKPPKR